MYISILIYLLHHGCTTVCEFVCNKEGNGGDGMNVFTYIINFEQPGKK